MRWKTQSDYAPQSENSGYGNFRINFIFANKSSINKIFHNFIAISFFFS